VGLMGLGTVGQGLLTLLDTKRRHIMRHHGVVFDLCRILVRDVGRKRVATSSCARLLDDAEAFLAESYDLVVEAVGGIEPANQIIASFLERGIPVVTANKALLAEKGPDLLALASRHETELRFEASVAAGIPLLGLLERQLQTTRVHRVTAILNGTSNYILSRLAGAGLFVTQAVEEAIRLGFAEADPSLDLAGMDAAQKLSVLARTLGSSLEVSDLEVEGVESILPSDCELARAFGCALKPIAVARLNGENASGFAAPALVRNGHPLAQVEGGHNGVLFEGDTLENLFFLGPGAGALPTAASLLDDMLAAIRRDAYPILNKAGGLFEDGDPEGYGSDIEISTDPPPTALQVRWFIALTPGKRGTRIDDLLDWVHSTGIGFRGGTVPRIQGDRRAEQGGAAMSRRIVQKFGGSVLTSIDSYHHAARHVACTVAQGFRVLVVVSARSGTTDALLEGASRVSPSPGAEPLDLLLSTGELQSAAWLCMALQQLDVKAEALNPWQLGLHTDGMHGDARITRINPIPLRVKLTECQVVIVPGFIGRGLENRITTLGRGGSDLSAVALAQAIDAEACEFFKDVPGYFSVDPNLVQGAIHRPWVTGREAVELSRFGCRFLQDRAIEWAVKSRCQVKLRALKEERRATRLCDDPPAGHPPALAITHCDAPDAFSERIPSRLGKDTALISVVGEGLRSILCIAVKLKRCLVLEGLPAAVVDESPYRVTLAVRGTDRIVAQEILHDYVMMKEALRVQSLHDRRAGGRKAGNA
jgi:homoserine dehydrogenase